MKNSQENNLTGRQSHWKTISLEDNLTGRQPHYTLYTLSSAIMGSSITEIKTHITTVSNMKESLHLCARTLGHLSPRQLITHSNTRVVQHCPPMQKSECTTLNIFHSIWEGSNINSSFVRLAFHWDWQIGIMCFNIINHILIFNPVMTISSQPCICWTVLYRFRPSYNMMRTVPSEFF